MMAFVFGMKNNVCKDYPVFEIVLGVGFLLHMCYCE